MMIARTSMQLRRDLIATSDRDGVLLFGSSNARRAIAVSLLLFAASSASAQPLATLEHRVVGAQLDVSPRELFVPKNIPGSLSVNIVSAEGSRFAELSRMGIGAHVEAVLRGPAFPAYRLLGMPNEPLMLPPIALPGEYQIDNIRLVHTESGNI